MITLKTLHQEFTINILGIDIKYWDIPAEEECRGTIFLTHGWISSKEVYIPIIPRLSLNHRVVAFDLPSYGNSGDTEIDSNLDIYIEVIGELVRKLGLEEVIFLGTSMGGMLSVRAAATFPELTKAVVAHVTPVHHSQLPIYFKNPLVGAIINNRWLINKRITKKIFKFFWVKERMKARNANLEYWEGKADIRIRMQNAMFTNFDRSTSNEYLRMCMYYIFNVDMSADIDQVTKPGLFIVNLHDYTIKPLLDLYQSNKNFELKVLDSKAHTFMEDNITQIENSMMEFIYKVDNSELEAKVVE